MTIDQYRRMVGLPPIPIIGALTYTPPDEKPMLPTHCRKCKTTRLQTQDSKDAGLCTGCRKVDAWIGPARPKG